MSNFSNDIKQIVNRLCKSPEDEDDAILLYKLIISYNREVVSNYKAVIVKLQKIEIRREKNETLQITINRELQEVKDRISILAKENERLRDKLEKAENLGFEL